MSEGTSTQRKQVIDAYLNGKSNTVTLYDRYAVDKASGNCGRFSMEDFEKKEAELAAAGWRVHRVKWESARERAERRESTRVKKFTKEDLEAFLAENPKITMRKGLEQLFAA